jgi:hypothetical protein
MSSRDRDPHVVVVAPGGTPKRINKPSVGMDDDITVLYPDVANLPDTCEDHVTRREFCARLDGFPEVERVRTKRAFRLVMITQEDMLEQWLRTRPGGWDGKIGPRVSGSES